ncbi:class I SAM-dependent methyltransferase [Bacillus sp. NEB1478]|uniref:class I SAM-dependent methyltransferase n=1 Tax=Bacillus sp. NEB1478 TaxID=3073816 RepID=UPI002872CF21|nr:class I SAM-dependent methyltransferase [Bacillus sp. NEB1478]WNB91000.1 class I SAM-dependent methyltransferase [Bacillus sp. NEB1478]
MQNMKKVKEDFDTIGKFAVQELEWDHNNHYHDYLLRFIPDDCKVAVDIGCGTGEFARKLADKSEQVYGFDVSPITIKKAIEFSKSYRNIKYKAEDIVEYSFEDESLDCFSSFAVLHHINLHELLPKLKKALKPGGVLIFLDLYNQITRWDYLPDLLAIPLNRYYLKTKPQRLKTEKELIAMQEHMKHDRYLSKKELISIFDTYLPANQFKIHLFWRYSLVWRKPV